MSNHEITLIFTRFYLSLIILCNLVVPIFFFSLAIAEEGDYFLKAGKVEMEKTPEGRVSLLKGGVTIHHEGAIITGNEGKVYEEEERALLRGEVRVEEKETLLKGEEGEYFRKKELAILKGKVEMINGEMTIRSDTLYYFRKNQHTEVCGNVELWDGKNEIRVKGREGWHDFLSNQSGMTKDPVLTTSGEKKGIRVTAERMLILRGEDAAFAIGDVKVFQEEVEITCDSLFYSLKEERAILLGNPILRESGDEIRGDVATLTFQNRELVDAILKGNAKGFTHPKKGERNEIEGEEIRISFENGEAEKITIEGSAKGRYTKANQESGSRKQ